jgi:hypothetical protein
MVDCLRATVRQVDVANLLTKQLEFLGPRRPTPPRQPQCSPRRRGFERPDHQPSLAARVSLDLPRDRRDQRDPDTGGHHLNQRAEAPGAEVVDVRGAHPLAQGQHLIALQEGHAERILELADLLPQRLLGDVASRANMRVSTVARFQLRSFIGMTPLGSRFAIQHRNPRERCPTGYADHRRRQGLPPMERNVARPHVESAGE